MKSQFTLIFILTSLSTLAFAHCPNAFTRMSKDYCMDYDWRESQVRQRSELVSTGNLSPFINAVDTKTHRRTLSTVMVRLWESGDKTHKPVELADLRIFPYMQMTDGMHHSAFSLTEYINEFNEEGEDFSGYFVSQMGLFDMEQGGCWSLRFTFSAENNLSSSFKIDNIENYTNVDAAKNMMLLGICYICGSSDPQEGDVSDHH